MGHGDVHVRIYKSLLERTKRIRPRAFCSTKFQPVFQSDSRFPGCGSALDKSVTIKLDNIRLSSWSRSDFPRLREIALGNFEAILGWKAGDDDKETSSVFAILYYMSGSTWTTLDRLAAASGMAIDGSNFIAELQDLQERGLIQLLYNKVRSGSTSNQTNGELSSNNSSSANHSSKTDGPVGGEPHIIDLTSASPSASQSSHVDNTNTFLPQADILDILHILDVKTLSKLVKRHNLSVKAFKTQSKISTFSYSANKISLIVAIMRAMERQDSRKKAMMEQDIIQGLGPGALRVSDPAIEDLDRAHLIFFAESGYSDVESLNFLRRGIKTLRFPSERWKKSFLPSSRNHSGALHKRMQAQLEAAARLRDDLDYFTHVGDAESAYICLHSASNQLMALEQIRCENDMPSTAIDKAVLKLIKMVLSRGIHLLEREKKYEQAIHYINICLSTKLDSWHALEIRKFKDMEHMGRPAAALLEFERILRLKSSPKESSSMSISLSTNQSPLSRNLGTSILAPSLRIGCERSCKKLSKPPRRWKMPIFHLRTAPTMDISGIRCEGRGWLNSKNDVSPALSVEQFALRNLLERQSRNGSCEDSVIIIDGDNSSTGDGTEGEASPCWKGEHYENHIVLTLFGLLTWDALWHPPTSKHVSGNLFYSDTPYGLLEGNLSERQVKDLDSLVHSIQSDPSTLETVIRRTWYAYKGIQSRGVCWSRFDLEDICAIAKGLGPSLCAEFIRMFSGTSTKGGDYLSWSSGCPDLILWKVKSPWCVKFAEVKGPGDRLSDSQLAWMDLLIQHGIDAVLVNVVEAKDTQNSA